MPGEWQPRPHPKAAKKKEPPPPPPSPEQSSTEMIDRNAYMLHELQSEIDRLKAELARQRKNLEAAPPAEPALGLEEILREARKQLSKLQENPPLSEEDEEPTA
jgi:hypothetical protein